MFLTHRRVKQGVALLDREIPGWAQFIDAKKLDMEYFDECVLGQLYSGNYPMGEAVLFGRDGRSAWSSNRESVAHGFYASLLSMNSWLTDEWRQVILLRQYEAMGLEEACPAQSQAKRPVA